MLVAKVAAGGGLLFAPGPSKRLSPTQCGSAERQDRNDVDRCCLEPGERFCFRLLDRLDGPPPARMLVETSISSTGGARRPADPSAAELAQGQAEQRRDRQVQQKRPGQGMQRGLGRLPAPPGMTSPG
jgi:hypothetical protein